MMQRGPLDKGRISPKELAKYLSWTSPDWSNYTVKMTLHH